jgi:hypothetical protein
MEDSMEIWSACLLCRWPTYIGEKGRTLGKTYGKHTRFLCFWLLAFCLFEYDCCCRLLGGFKVFGCAPMTYDNELQQFSILTMTSLISYMNNSICLLSLLA